MDRDVNRARAAELGIHHPERVRAVAFDAVGTLIFPSPPVAAIYEEIGARHGSRRTRAAVARKFREAFARAETETPPDPADWDRPDVLCCDEPGEQARWRAIVTTALDDARDPEACFEELFAHFARPSAWAVFADVKDALAGLMSLGCRTAIVSNFDARLLELRRGIPELQDIDAALVSSLVGYRKPSPFFYRAVCETLALRPDEVLVVGDDWRCDVEGPRRAGLQAVFLQRDDAGGPVASLSAIRSLRELVPLLLPAVLAESAEPRPNH